MGIVEYIVLAVVVVLFLVMLVMGMRRSAITHKRRKYRVLYESSAGDFDKEAATALVEINNLPERRAEDDFTAGNIVELNRNNANMRRAHANREDTVILRHYRDTLHDLYENPLEPRDINPIFMIDYIGGFIERNENDLRAIPAGGDFINYYAETAPAIRHETTEQRKVAAAAATETRVDFIDNYLERTKTHTRDPQNVHDSSVNVGLRSTMDALRNSTYTRPHAECIKEARDYITNSDMSAAKRERALRALDKVSLGEFNGTVNASETEVFSTVWSRTHDPANAENAELMRESVAEALADFYDKRPDGTYHEHPICVNGRSGRLLTSLVTLDHDDGVGAVNTLENYKNEIMEDVKKALHREIEHAKNSDDEQLRTVARSYEDPNVEVPAEAEARFKDIVKKEIDVIVEAKKGVLAGGEEAIKRDAYAAIE